MVRQDQQTLKQSRRLWHINFLLSILFHNNHFSSKRLNWELQYLDQVKTRYAKVSRLPLLLYCLYSCYVNMLSYAVHLTFRLQMQVVIIN